VSPSNLKPGVNQLLYVGPALPVEQALALFAGKYTAVDWQVPRSPVYFHYVPGISGNQPFLTSASVVVIVLTEPVTLPPDSAFVVAHSSP
jgi:hypothetical protein